MYVYLCMYLHIYTSFDMFRSFMISEQRHPFDFFFDCIVCVYVCVCICVRVRVRMRVYMRESFFDCACVCVFVSMSVSVSVSISVSESVSVSVSVSVCLCVYVCTAHKLVTVAGWGPCAIASWCGCSGPLIGIAYIYITCMNL